MRFKTDLHVFGKIQDKLRSSPLLKNFIMRKISSKELGIIRKIEYYSFVKELLGLGSESIEKAIRDNFFELAKKPISRMSFSQRDFIHTLMQSMTKHNLIKSEHLGKLIFSKETSRATKLFAIESLGDVKQRGSITEEIAIKILNDKSFDKKHHESLLRAISKKLVQIKRSNFSCRENPET